MNSFPISSGIQTQFTLPSYKHSFISIPSSHNISCKFQNTHAINPSLTILRNSNLVPKALSSATNSLETEETLYDLLGISESVPVSEIKQAYKQMALKYHPDVSPPDRVDEYTIRFIKVQEAYETLSDPKARAMYDNSIAKGLHLAFSRTQEKAQWREPWQVQLAELQRRTKVDRDRDRTMSWAARIREQRIKTGPYGSDTDQ